MQKKDQTNFDSGNLLYVNDSVEYIFMWLKFKPAGFNEYSEVLVYCHIKGTKVVRSCQLRALKL